MAVQSISAQRKAKATRDAERLAELERIVTRRLDAAGYEPFGFVAWMDRVQKDRRGFVRPKLI
jgi:predicted Zn-dependent protease